MVAQAAKLKATSRPVEWDTLFPSDSSERVKWQVWMREKGAGYWVMRFATRLARRLGASVSNPNGLEEGGTYDTEEEAQDVCRIFYQQSQGRYALTYTPLVIGRTYPVKSVLAAGDRYFEPFKTFDFSATEAVKEQACHVLVSVEDYRRIAARLTGIRDMAEP